MVKLIKQGVYYMEGELVEESQALMSENKIVGKIVLTVR